MEKTVNLLITCGVMFCFILLASNTKYKKIEDSQSFKLKKIDSLTYNFNNILHFEKDSMTYIVVTEKMQYENCQKLLIGEIYKLEINSALPTIYFKNPHITSQYMYGDEIIYYLDGNNISWGLYKAKNIKGLCIEE